MVAVDHDAELQYQLGGALEEGLQQPQHADVSALKHHSPVIVLPLVLPPPAALHTQVQCVEVPGHPPGQGEGRKEDTGQRSGVRRSLMYSECQGKCHVPLQTQM